MNQKEKELFLELCAFHNPNAKKIERLLNVGAATPEVLGMLFANRMAGVAYHVLVKTALLDAVDREFRNSLCHEFMLNVKINEDFLGCINFLSKELDASGVRYALLKGAYLCYRYPWGSRTSNDIDVLIAPEDVGKVSTMLKMAGFRQGYLKKGVFVPATRQQIIESKMTRGETVPFIKETKLPLVKYLEVDLNFSLDYKNSDDTSLKEMLAHTRSVTVGASSQIRTLALDDFILHLCTHLYKEATTLPWIRMKRDMTYYKYCDIYMLLQRFTGEDLEGLLQRARSMDMEKEFLYAMYSVESLFELSKLLLYEGLYPNYDFTEVIAPAEKRKYGYTQKDVKKRFFSKDRISLLEVREP